MGTSLIMKHIFIKLTVREGEFEHTHKILHTSNCKNLEFAVNWYVAHYWGHGQRYPNDDWWWWDGVHCGQIDYWTDVPEEDYKVLRLYI